MLFKAYERVGIGLYLCTKCGAKIKIYTYGGVLQPCKICNYKKFIKVELNDVPPSDP
jgi:DNA-directed RNA polymerase subunit RPC12/RpoP